MCVYEYDSEIEVLKPKDAPKVVEAVATTADAEKVKDALISEDTVWVPWIDAVTVPPGPDVYFFPVGINICVLL